MQIQLLIAYDSIQILKMKSNITNAIKSHVTDALSDALTSARKQNKLQTLHANHSETKFVQMQDHGSQL